MAAKTSINTLKGKRILITCGPTWVPLDNVRVISNLSSGALGQMLARKLLRSKAKITLLEGPVLSPSNIKNIKIIKYKTLAELDRALFSELSKGYDCIIHASAVSDYRPKTKKRSKIRSDLKTWNLELVPTRKIINRLKKASSNAFLVGFKLETNINRLIARQQSLKLFIQAKCDLVIVNSLNKENYSGYIVDRKGNVLPHGDSRDKISNQLIEQLKANL